MTHRSVFAVCGALLLSLGLLAGCGQNTGTTTQPQVSTPVASSGTVTPGAVLTSTTTLTGTQAMTPTIPLSDALKSQEPLFTVLTQTVTVGYYMERLQEVVQRVLTQGVPPEQLLADQQRLRTAVFDGLVQEELLLAEARKEGIGVTAEEVDAEMQNPMNPAPTFNDPAKIREFFTRQQIIYKMIAHHTTADMYHARHILLPATAEVTATQILDRIQKGEDFATLARQYSEDPGSKDKGGQLEWAARGDFVPEFEKVGFDAELHKPLLITSTFGFHIIEVQDRALNRPFDTIEALRSSPTAQQHYQDTFIPWYNKLREQAEQQGELKINKDRSLDTLPVPVPAVMPEVPGLGPTVEVPGSQPNDESSLGPTVVVPTP